MGLRNYWRQYTYGNLCYGRCTKPYYTDDKNTIDYPLGCGSVVFSPYKRGTITFPGRTTPPTGIAAYS